MGLAVNQSYENSESKEKAPSSSKDSLAFLKSTSADFKTTAVPVLSLYNHLVIYLFLPIAKKSVAFIFGAVCSLICMILFVSVELSFVRFLGDPFFLELFNKTKYLQGKEEDEWNAWQIAQQCLADLVFYISLNFVGFYIRYVNEINMRRGFLDKRSCIETTFKLKYEKEQEVIYFLACSALFAAAAPYLGRKEGLNPHSLQYLFQSTYIVVISFILTTLLKHTQGKRERE